MSENEPLPVNEKLVALNVRNREFYGGQARLLEERMADPILRDAAFRSLASEQLRQLPIYFQTPLELALQEAEQDRNEFRGDLARSGGKAAKPDTLRQLILSIVRRCPEISYCQLLEELKKHVRGPTIDEIDAKFIYFKKISNDNRGEGSEGDHTPKRVTSLTAPISGLKYCSLSSRQKGAQARTSMSYF